MADYKAMYLAAMDAMERAIETLTAAQQRCEDLYVASSGEERAARGGGGRCVNKKRGRTRSVLPLFHDVLRLTQTDYPSCAAALSA